MSLKKRISQALPGQDKPDDSSVTPQSIASLQTATATVTPEEQAWALTLHQKLVKIMDLSLIASMEE